MNLWVREFQMDMAVDAKRVRQLPARRGAARPRSRPQPAAAAPGTRAVVPLLCGIMAVLFYVSQSAASTRASYEINTLQSEQVRLLAEQENLTVQLAQARSASRVNASAGALGLRHPESWDYLPPVASQAVALSRDQPPAARNSAQTVLTTVVAALMGRTAVAEASSR